MRSVRISVMVLLMGVAANASATWLGDDCQHKTPRKLSVPASGITHVVVVGRAGSLRVTGRDGATEVGATGTACASSSALLDQVQLTQSRSGSELRIEAVTPDDLMFEAASLDFEVTLPANVAVSLRDGSGDTTIDNVGTLDVHDGSGDLTISNVHGELSVEDGSGELRIQNVVGDVRITDGSGSIEVRHVGGSVTIPHDGSGSVNIREVKRDVHIESKGSGSVTVADVGGNLTVDHKGSGGISYERVAGRVDVPNRR
jgi:hypothetical protein